MGKRKKMCFFCQRLTKEKKFAQKFFFYLPPPPPPPIRLNVISLKKVLKSLSSSAISCPALVEAQGTAVNPKSCLVKDGRKVSDTCTFSCLSGYEMADPSMATVTCLKTGWWSGAVVTCTRKSLIIITLQVNAPNLR